MRTKEKGGKNKISSNKTEKSIRSNDDSNNPEIEINFRKAYNKLVTKISENKDNLLLNPEEVKNTNERYYDSKTSEEFNNRVKKYADQYQKDKTTMKKEIEQEEKKLCTFSPKTNNPNDEHRPLEVFLEHQARFLKHKEQNSLPIPEEIINPIPKIDKNSVSIINMKISKVPFHDRLYALPKKDKPEEKNEKQKKVTGERRDLRLYQMALKKQEQIKSNHDKKSKKKMDPKSDPVLIEGFHKEFAKSLEDSKISANEDNITYDEMIKILKTMRFIPNKATHKEVNDLIESLWKSIKENNEHGSIKSLKAYTSAILNINISTSLPEKKLRIVEINKIATKYRLLATIRKSNKPKKQPKNPEGVTFKPLLCKESIEIAKKHRDKILPKQENTNFLSGLEIVMVNEKKYLDE